MKKLYLLLILSLITPSLIAGYGTIKGKIIDQKTGEPLPFVNVVVDNSKLGAVTGEDGIFVISNLKAGFVTLKASFIG